MGNWSFLSNHARALLFLAGQPETRLRDLAVALGVTERTAYAIVVDLSEAGYVVKERDVDDARRNRYHVQGQVPLKEPNLPPRTLSEVVELFGDAQGA